MQFLLDDPAGIDSQKTSEHKDIEGALVVRHDHIGLFFDDISPADDIHPHGGYEAVETRPSRTGDSVRDIRTGQKNDEDAQGNKKNGGEDK